MAVLDEVEVAGVEVVEEVGGAEEVVVLGPRVDVAEEETLVTWVLVEEADVTGTLVLLVEAVEELVLLLLAPVAVDVVVRVMLPSSWPSMIGAAMSLTRAVDQSVEFADGQLNCCELT